MSVLLGHEARKLEDRGQKHHTVPVMKRSKHYPRSYWVRQIEDYAKSALTLDKFCSSRGIAYSTFTKWKKILRSEQDSSGGEFVPVEIKKSQTLSTPPEILTSKNKASPELKLTINHGLILTIPKGFDVATLRQVVEALSSC